MSSLTEIQDRFRRFGPEQAAGPFGSPLYVALCAGLADDPETAALLLNAAPGQQIPNLLLAGVHDLLLGGGDEARHPLARYYATIVSDPTPPDDHAYQAFRAFCGAFRGALLHRIRTRSTQTNEPRRAAVLFPALGLIARASGRPVALLEAGASAGLLLQPDCYGYAYGDRRAGDLASTLQLGCELLPPLEPPIPSQVAIAWRAGLDLAPVDVTDAIAVRWLSACLWPEHLERAEDLRRAISLARETSPHVARGDLVDDLTPLMAQAPLDAALVVMHATALLYLTDARSRRFVEAVEGAARRLRRPIWLLSFESAGILRRIDDQLGRLAAGDVPGRPSAGLAVSTFPPQRIHDHRLLAVAHPHGRWLRWLDAASGTPSGDREPRIGPDA